MSKFTTRVNLSDENFVQTTGSTLTLSGTTIFKGNISFDKLTVGVNNVATGITTVAVGDSNIASGYASVAEGYTTNSSGDYSHSEGQYVDSKGLASHAGGRGVSSKHIIALGTSSFNHSSNSIIQGSNQGALGDYSAILGGKNHNIATGNTGAAIIGGDSIKLSGSSYVNTVAVNAFAIWDTPSAGGGNDLLTWNSNTKKIGKVAQSSISGGGGSGSVTGITNIGGDTNGLFTSIINKDVKLKSLVAGSNITLTPTSTGVTINSTSSGSITGGTNGLSVNGANIKLGGTITGTTIIDGTSTQHYQDNNNLFIKGFIDSNKVALINVSNNITFVQSRMLAQWVGGESTTIQIDANSTGSTMIVNSDRTGFKGIQYGGDYSVNFNARSLVDAGFVTGITSMLVGGTVTGATNGLTLSGGNIILGGTLNASTTINGDNQDLTINNLNSYYNVVGSGTGYSRNYLTKGTTTYVVNDSHYSNANYATSQLLSTQNQVQSRINQQLGSNGDSTLQLDNSYTQADLILNTEWTSGSTYNQIGINGNADTANTLLYVGIYNNIVGGTDKVQEIKFSTFSGSNGATFTDTFNNAGLQYADNYSANFRARSLVDAGFVTGITSTLGSGGGTITGATNGLSLTTSGKKIKLGGNLTGTTTIGLITNDLIFTGTTGTLKYGANYSANFTVRSLIDAGYVTGLTSLAILSSNNGLTKSGTTVQLGGALSKSLTTISGYTGGAKATSFNIGSGFNGVIWSMAVQSDNKILAGGAFTTFTGSTNNRFIRINTDGTKDSTFNIGSGFGGSVLYFALQSDGKIIVGGSYTTFTGSTNNRLIRLNTDGTKDSTFNIGSGFGTSSVTRVAVQADGKILVGGDFTTFTGSTNNRFIRLNSNGTKDSTFNIGTGFNGIIRSIYYQTDGKILVGGDFTTFTGSTNNHLIRLNSNGTKDTTFSVGTAFGSSSVIAPYTIAVQSDGKILLGGTFTTFTGSTNNYIIRLNSNGTKDTTFNLGSAFNSDLLSIVVQADSKIICGGDFTTFTGSSNNRFIRLNSDGTKDSTFNIGTGFNAVSFGVQSIAVNTNGEIFVGGDYSTYNGSSTNRLIQLGNDSHVVISNPAGISYGGDYSRIFTRRTLPDVSYLTGITTLLQSKSFFNTFTGTTAPATYANKTIFVGYTGATNTRINTIETNYLTGATNGLSLVGKIVKLGGLLTGTTTIQNLTVTSGDGNKDSTFNIGTGFNGTITQNSIAVDNNNKIYVAGLGSTFTGSTYGKFLRLNSNGTKDSTFSVGSGFNFNIVSCVYIQSDGKLIVGGDFSTFTGSSNAALIRLNTNGTKDSTFNIGTGFGNAVFSVGIQSDGKLVVGGAFQTFTGTSNNYLIRLNSNGTKDSTFNIGTGFGPGISAYIQAIAIQPDGKILVGGRFGTYTGSTNNRLIRLNSDGTKDSTFNIGSGFGGDVYAIELQSDGKILVGGIFNTFTGSTNNCLIRLNSNGTKDSTFNISTGFNNLVLAVKSQSDGRILVGGQFTTYTGSTNNRLIRLNSNGTKDSTFNIGTGFGNIVNSIVQQSDYKYLIGGTFTTYTGSTNNRLIRLTNKIQNLQLNFDSIIPTYTTNLSSSYGSRSFVDMGYVTGLTSSFITGGTNIGGNTNGLFTSVSGRQVQLKSLVAGANITLTPTSTGITITNSSSSGLKYVTLQVKSSTVVIAGNKGNVIIPYSGTITRWYLNTDVNASIVIDLWKRNGANPNAGDTITGSALPSLTASNYGTSTTLTGWNTTVIAGDKIELDIVSNDLATYIQILVEIAV